MVCEKMSKTGFQNGGFGGHLGFPIDQILAHFDIEADLLIQSKFRLKSTKGLERDVKNRFLRWRLWWPFFIFDQFCSNYFASTMCPDAPHQVSNQLDHVVRGAVQNMNFQHFSHINV